MYDPFTDAAITGDTYTATSTGGASGFTSSGSGNIQDLSLTLPSGSSITYTVTATISGSATVGSTITNSAYLYNAAFVEIQHSTDTDTVTASTG